MSATGLRQVFWRSQSMRAPAKTIQPRTKGKMNTGDLPQSAISRDFPVEWYDLALEQHFWMLWRLNVILRHLRQLKIDDITMLKGFDIGCGHGAFQRQLHSALSWSIDGCDLNKNAIALNVGHNGNGYLYDIFEFQENLKEKYDLIFLLDVIEHVPDPIGFLKASRFYLKNGGYIIINVPAGPSLYSKYDVIAGHIRRYTKDSLNSEIAAAGLAANKILYWGLSLVPLLILRKITLWFVKPETAIRRGFVPPSNLTDKLLRLIMSAELATQGDVPFGTSLLAIAREVPR